jgi:hypothetical protein
MAGCPADEPRPRRPPRNRGDRRHATHGVTNCSGASGSVRIRSSRWAQAAALTEASAATTHAASRRPRKRR